MNITFKDPVKWTGIIRSVQASYEGIAYKGDSRSKRNSLNHVSCEKLNCSETGCVWN